MEKKQFDTIQQQAIDRCLGDEKIVCVSGAAGTGKTTIIQEVFYRLADEYGEQVVICAPTGKAAKRITEATGIQAMTVHRLLEYTYPGEPYEIFKEKKIKNPETGKIDYIDESYDPPKFEESQDSVPRRSRGNPLNQTRVIVDEAAMLPRETYSALVEALRVGSRLIMYGDVNQLNPIERAGDKHKEPIFKLLFKKYNGITLEKIYRQGEGSGIVKNGTRIKNGQVPMKFPDCALRFTDSPIQLLKSILKGQDVDYRTVNNQIITPTKKGWSGTVKVNAMLQNLFRPEDAEWLPLPRSFWTQGESIRVHEGDKVIVTRNLYDVETNQGKGVFNGETGIITKIDFVDDCLWIDLGDRVAHFPERLVVRDESGEIKSYDPRCDLDLAYAITTHKSQGSEYDNVIYLLSTASGMMRNRQNLYTGVTRARHNCTIVADAKSLNYAVWNTEDKMRERKGKKGKK